MSKSTSKSNPKPPAKHRARTHEDKIARREKLISIAWQLFSESVAKGEAHQLPSADAITKKAKVSKATLFLYFESMEDLYLTVLLQGFERWCQVIIDRFINSPKLPLIAHLFASLEGKEVFLSLSMHSILNIEASASEAVRNRYKLAQGDAYQRLAEAINAQYGIDKKVALERLMLTSAAVIGAYQSCLIAKQFPTLPAFEKHKFFRIDFKTISHQSLGHIWNQV